MKSLGTTEFGESVRHSGSFHNPNKYSRKRLKKKVFTEKMALGGPSCCGLRREQFCGRSRKLQLDLFLLSPVEGEKPSPPPFF